MPWKPIQVSKEDIAAARRAFAGKARFLMDENVDAVIPEYLRSRKLNVLTLDEVSLKGHPDEHPYAIARQLKRVLVTQDKDLLDDREYPPKGHPGIVVIADAQGNTDLLVDIIVVLRDVIAPLRKLWVGAKVRIGAEGHFAITQFEAVAGRRRERRYKIGKRDEAWEWIDVDSE